jgi:hypothetical protein
MAFARLAATTELSRSLIGELSLRGGHNVHPDLDVTQVADAPSAAYV